MLSRDGRRAGRMGWVGGTRNHGRKTNGRWRSLYDTGLSSRQWFLLPPIPVGKEKKECLGVYITGDERWWIVHEASTVAAATDNEDDDDFFSFFSAMATMEGIWTAGRTGGVGAGRYFGVGCSRTGGGSSSWLRGVTAVDMRPTSNARWNTIPGSICRRF